MHLSPVRVAVAGLLLFAAAGCSGGPGQSAGKNTGQGDTGHSNVVSAKDFSLSRFSDSTDVTNKWFPLKPGTQFVFEGHAEDDGERLQRRVVTTVTDLTKFIADVRTVVVWDRDYDDGELIESEIAFFAQDTSGNGQGWQ
jgi:hypothetical protein